MKQNEFLVAMKVLELAYPQFGVLQDKNALSLWYEMFREHPAVDFALAVRRYIETSKTTPTIAGIKEMMPAPGLTPEEAWETVYNLLVKGKPGTLPEDEALRRTVEVFHSQLRDMKTTEVPIVRAQFLKYYAGLKRRVGERALTQERIRILTSGLFKELKK
jgi:hypothetical protein